MNTQLPSKEVNRLWDDFTILVCDMIMCGMIAAIFVIACVA